MRALNAGSIRVPLHYVALFGCLGHLTKYLGVIAPQSATRGSTFIGPLFCLLLFCLPKAAHITPPLANLWAICKECDETGTFMAATPRYTPLVIKIPTEFLLRLCEAE